ncbi:MAG: diguanylate cyclase [Myxococcota bacterium]
MALRPLGRSLITSLLILLWSGSAWAQSVIDVGEPASDLELGRDFLLWHDPLGEATLEDAVEAYQNGSFAPPGSKGSTGLAPGAFWSRFELRNASAEPVPLRLEYIDHQLIYLRAYAGEADGPSLTKVVDLALDRPFRERSVTHHRFVIPVELPAGRSMTFYVQYGSHQMGFVFPKLRLWTPNGLQTARSIELGLMLFLAGGLMVMAFIALISGLATGGRFFYIYSLHALASTAVWLTVFGFTHQFLITEGFHWKYMSITGGFSLLTGLLFAREFLQSRKYMRRFDYLLLFLIANSLFLLVNALAEQTALAVISITLALLLYPAVSLAGLYRWYQGSREAAIFTAAWTFLVIGLFTQALRDLGLVEHNLINYYWPAVASYGEMAVILIAMGVRIRDLKELKEAAERGHLEQLTASKAILEAQVAERTRELEEAKNAAELEARTDLLTGVDNRRSFMSDGQQMLNRCRRDGLPLNVAMLDIDHFKSINDQYGHTVGDHALVAFATTVAGSIRSRDLFGRLGGEEFALMFISEAPGARQMVNELCERIRGVSVDTPEGSVGFTASIGVVPLDQESRLEELLERADEALYSAKELGRDRVVFAREGASPAVEGTGTGA